jgi:hypothetical protein
VKADPILGYKEVVFEECAVPGLDVCVIRIDQGAVQVENYGSGGR